MDALMKLANNGVSVNYDDIAKICRKYRLSELSVFGSSIRDDFRVDSDIDILITYEDVFTNAPFDFLEIREEFQRLLKRNVDIVDKDALRNPIRKRNILSTCEVIYANH